MVKRKWDTESLSAALVLSADVGLREAAKSLGMTTNALGLAFFRHGLSIKTAREALNDNKPAVKISLGKGGFDTRLAWAIPLARWCPSAAQLELQPHGCRWISGFPPEAFSYCGEQKAANSNFCDAHKKVSKVPKLSLTKTEKIYKIVGRRGGHPLR